MTATYVNVKNRQLKIIGEKVYDVSLIEQDDIVQVKPGRLLMDLIVIKGTAVATQSTRSGSDEKVTIGKGERLESGSEIHEVT